ncbi:plasminogen [Strongylocentrotus purpuratus]|uniref:Kringle domain-containing protein n=1 Tax=Strongylocentrotus purpuratus TaxID=7668 RepID=A0A7M7RFM3_STRPU|nr:plasminogen [Strongylocentrotus purpuratus]|eukprot:XP_783300.1 PREDICTED: plasminogen [Strongylocentrotus purpuratus]
MAQLFLYMALAATFVLVSSIPRCTDDPNGTNYRGELAQTISGKECLSWTSPNPKIKALTPAKYPNAGLGDHNYCRNPDNEFTAWCYTTDPDTRWEYCAVGDFSQQCTSRECYHLHSARDYRGDVSTTRSGRECQNWTSQSPHRHSITLQNNPSSGLGNHNLCRNAGSFVAFAWCYTTDPSVRWEFCNIGLPEGGC